MEINEKDLLDLFTRLWKQLEQAGINQQGCSIKLVYVASGGQHVENQHNYYGEKKDADSGRRDPYEALFMQIIEPMKKVYDKYPLPVQ